MCGGRPLVGAPGAHPVRGRVQPAHGPGPQAALAPPAAPRARHLRRLPRRDLARTGTLFSYTNCTFNQKVT
jgi:hypothetical protein